MTTGTGAPLVEPWVEQVLGYWFGELDRAGWFRKSEATDAAIRDRFANLHETLKSADVARLSSDWRTALAAIVVLDQFPRNIHRDTPDAFASDDKARELAEVAVARGFDQGLTVDQRLFMYLPFEHSVHLPDQDKAVALISALGDAEYTRYAEAHRDVIRRFGRFPHRNAILGRASTEAEQAYLAQPGSGF
jgi:uncharacterized protein (DUF924 family)